MCRHLAYVGAPIRIGELLSDPPYGLRTQAYRPRRQTRGLLNADGFGVGWYVEGVLEPARHRGGGPLWADETFADLARVIRTPALLAAVRSATDGTASGQAAAAPFRSGRWLFSHNGLLAGWPAAAAALASRLSPQCLLDLEARTDSALLWALARARLLAGASLAQAVADVVQQAQAVCGGSLNLLLTDGRDIAASCCGASLSWHQGPRGVVVASEPYDDDPGWHDVPEAHLVTAGPDGVQLHPI